jgi:hypothetical protein
MVDHFRCAPHSNKWPCRLCVLDIAAKFAAALGVYNVGNVPDEVFRTIAVMLDPVNPEARIRDPIFRKTVEAAYIHGRGNYAEEYGRLRREQGWTT